MNNVKAAVYSGTRNLYDAMLPAVKSLLMHSDVDKVYLLIEDDEFPVKLPKEVECINVSRQTYLKLDSPNMNTSFTYMALIRAALPKIFPDIDVILSLDVDAIVEQDISDIWDLPLGDEYYLSASSEPGKSSQKYIYANTGVALYNLKKLRDDGMVDKILDALNTQFYQIIEQDCINEFCRGHILDMPSEYNATRYTVMTDNPKIIHYAGMKKWDDKPGVLKYRDISFDEIAKIRKSKSYMKVQHKTKYMIHACPERMWYVNDYLIPSMLEQGIDRACITVHVDNDHVGNLESCMQSFRKMGRLGDGATGTWHLQDDVVISPKFKEKTEHYDNGIVCGFCNVEIDGMGSNYIWGVQLQFAWLSFPCIRIPDFYAWECADWYYNNLVANNLHEELRRDGKNDDLIWRTFMNECHPEAMVINLKPNIVDHVDYLLGGSVANSHRNARRRSFYWEYPEVVEDLEKRLGGRQS